MSVYDDIRAVLEYTLENTAGLPEIFWENVDYQPTTGTPHLKVIFFPTSRRPAVRGLSPQQRYQGLFRLVLYCPENLGPGSADDYADTLLTAFNATTDLTYNSTTVSIDYSERSGGQPMSPWYQVTVDVAWYHYN